MEKLLPTLSSVPLKATCFQFGFKATLLDPSFAERHCGKYGKVIVKKTSEWKKGANINTNELMRKFYFVIQ